MTHPADKDALLETKAQQPDAEAQRRKTSIEAQWVAIQAACAALAGVPGAEISVGASSLSEGDVEVFVRLIPGATSSRHEYASDSGNKQPYLIFSFSAVVEGVRIRGQGSRAMTDEELKACQRLFASNSRYLSVDEALRAAGKAV